MRPMPGLSCFLPLLALAACAPVSLHEAAPDAARVADAAARAPTPQDDTLNATAWFQSLERDLVFREVYRAAGAHLDAALRDPGWDALPKGERDRDARGLPPAIIVDVDETVLDNSPQQVRQIRARREGFDEAAWAAWIDQRAAKPLPGALEFLQAAATRGVTVFYISNRDAAQSDATVANLRSAGFPIATATQFLGLGTVVEGCTAQGSSKACRRQLVGRGHRVLMQFGDQLGDFVQIDANTPAGRAGTAAPYAGWIGERWWVLPNPMYGSWEAALSAGAVDTSAAARRAAKEAALDAAAP